jgi:hypothetical protein
MTYTITEKQGKQILLVTISDPFSLRTDMPQMTEQLHTALGEVTSMVYMIYDIRQFSLNFADIISGVTGFSRPQTKLDKQLAQHGRMILVGSSTLITVAAKAAARLSPSKPTLTFATPEEAVEYARAELAKQH